ncbi:MAG: hypothetical protein ACYTHJ_07475 [Planctomycetota bacterium]
MIRSEQDVEIKIFAEDFFPESIAAYQQAFDCDSYEASISGTALSIVTDCSVGQGVFDVDFCQGINENDPGYL